jgi:hypothetical protein
VFCRYSGPNLETIFEWADSNKVPTIFHIDDDLLNVPMEIGKVKHEYHNQPNRIDTVRSLLDRSSLVYCSTPALLKRLKALGMRAPALAGEIYCSHGKLYPAPSNREPITLGYMGFDHAHDFELVLPVIIELMDELPTLHFSLFGSIPKPFSLNKFAERVSVHAPIQCYEAFMQRFSELGWHIGICPLAKTQFNEVKANTKWIEYSSIGAAVVVSKDSIYDECIQSDSALLAQNQTEWKAMLLALIFDQSLRGRLVANAQSELTKRYSPEHLCQQVLKVFDVAVKSCKS